MNGGTAGPVPGAGATIVPGLGVTLVLRQARWTPSMIMRSPVLSRRADNPQAIDKWPQFEHLRHNYIVRTDEKRHLAHLIDDNGHPLESACPDKRPNRSTACGRTDPALGSHRACTTARPRIVPDPSIKSSTKFIRPRQWKSVRLTAQSRQGSAQPATTAGCQPGWRADI